MKHIQRKTAMAVICLLIIITAGFSNEYHDQADAYWNRAMASKKEKKYKDAIDQLTAAVIAEKKSGNVRNEEYLAQLKELGGLYVTTGDRDRVGKCYALIIEFAQKISDQGSESDAYFGLGKMYQEKGDHDKAIESFGRSLDIETKINRSDRAMAAQNGIANAYRDKGEFALSAEHYARALERMGSGGLEENRAALLNNLGTSKFYSGDYRNALSCFGRALELDEKAPSKKYLSTDFANMASAFHVMGKLNEAIDLYGRALEIDRKTDTEKVPARLFRIAEALHQKGDYNRALLYCDDSLKAMEETGNVKNRGHVFSQIGKTYDAMGQYDRALDNYLKAAEVEGNGDAEAAASRLADIGMFYESRGMYDQAYNYFSIALKSGKEAAGKLSRAENYRNAGRVLLYLKRYAEAQKYLQQAAGLDESIGNREGLARDYDYLGRGKYMAEQYREAADTFTKALGIVEQAGGWEKEPGDTEQEITAWLVASLVKAGSIEEALNAELKKSRRECSAYLESGRIARFKSGAPAKIAAFPDGSALVVIANVAWDEPLVIVKTGSGTGVIDIDKKGMVKHFYEKYGNDINAYSRSMTSELNIIKGTSIHNYHYDFRRILFYYQSLLMKKDITLDDQKMINALGKDLYLFLFKNIDSKIAGTKKVFILSEDALRSFAFETLVRPEGAYLAENYVFQHQYLDFPNDAQQKKGAEGIVSVWAEKTGPVARPEAGIDTQRYRDFIRAEVLGKIRGGASLRDEGEYFGLYEKPEAPYAAAERDTIGRAGAGQQNSSFDAGEEKLRRLFSSAGVRSARAVHFGCVWSSDSLVTSLSTLIYPSAEKKNDGLVDLRELSGLDISAWLVTISSAGRTIMNPGEPAGLVCASLMSSGCNAVAIPLWAVDDRARVIFWKRVYDRLGQKDADPADVIAQVRRSFIARQTDPAEAVGLYSSQPEYEEEMKKISNPYYWASYIFYGR